MSTGSGIGGKSMKQVATDVAFGRAQGVQGTPAVRVRYGDNPAQLIVLNGQPIEGGGASTDQLHAMMAAQAQQ